jgi:hypothetical protein
MSRESCACPASVPFPRRLTVLSSLTGQAWMIFRQYAFNPVGRYSLFDEHVPGFPTLLSHTRAFQHEADHRRGQPPVTESAASKRRNACRHDCRFSKRLNSYFQLPRGHRGEALNGFTAPMVKEYVASTVVQQSAERRGPNLALSPTEKFAVCVYRGDQRIYLAYGGKLSSRQERSSHGIHLMIEIERAEPFMAYGFKIKKPRRMEYLDSPIRHLMIDDSIRCFGG